jgi:WD40 repeat protein
MTGRPNTYRCLAASPTSNTALIGQDDGSVLAWDYASGRHHLLHRHSGSVNSVACHPSGLMAASGGDDFTVRYWNMADSSVDPEAAVG